MRRTAQLGALICLVSIQAFGQHRGFGRAGVSHFGGFRGGGFGHFGGFRGGFGHFGFRGGGFGHFGFRGGFGHFGGFHRGFGFRPRAFVRTGPFFSGGLFYSAPLFYGGFGYNGDFGYPYLPPPPPNVVIVVPPAPPYDDYDRGPREIVRREPAPAPGGAISYPPEQVYFSLALKDGTVETGIAYWVEGTTLHYLTQKGKHQQVPLASVDRARSEQLNRSGPIEFRLPPE